MRTYQLQRINLLWFCTLGITALAAGFLVYILLLESALGAFSIREAAPLVFSEAPPPRILIHESLASKATYVRLYGDALGSARYDSTFSAWNDILKRRLGRNRKPETIDSRGLSTGALAAEDVLILPASIALSEAQIERVRIFVHDGGSLLVSWGAGLYDGAGAWRGWNFMESTFGFRFESFEGPGPDDYLVSTDSVPGTAPEGIYVPRYRYDAVAADRVRRRSAAQNAEYERHVRDAESSAFKPLQDFVWFDSVNANTPRFDYALVRSIGATDAGARGDSVALSFYTWVGDDGPGSMPWPRTESYTRRFTLRSGTPLTAGIPGGYRAKVQVYSPGVNMRITDADRVQSAGFWYDFATDQPVATDILEPASGLLYGTYGSGRFVVMGFGPDALGATRGDPEDEMVFGRLYDNVLAYLQRIPLIWTHDWPSGFDAAVLVAPSVTSAGTGVEQMLDFFRYEDVPATFFIGEHVSSASSTTASRLAAVGEVGLLDDRDRVGASESAFAARLSGIRAALMTATGDTVIGYRAGRPGQLSSTVLSALTSAGFQYFLPDSIGRRTTPKIMGSPYASLTRIGVTVTDDRLTALGDTSRAAGDVVSSALNEATRVIDEGGVYRVAPDSRLFSEARFREAFTTLVDRLKLENVWFANGEDIARWSRLRRGLNADVEQRSPSRIFVRVSNDNGDTADHATVSISLGRKVSSVRIKPELINILRQTDDEIAVPPHRLTADGTVLELTIRELKPQQYRIFHIDLFSGEPDTSAAGMVSQD